MLRAATKATMRTLAVRGAATRAAARVTVKEAARVEMVEGAVPLAAQADRARAVVVAEGVNMAELAR